MYYVYIRIVESAPAEKTQGWVGWNMTSKIPKSLYDSWLHNLFNGTIKGFCNRSLKMRKTLIILIPYEKEIVNKTRWFHLTCTPFHAKQWGFYHRHQKQKGDNVYGKLHLVHLYHVNVTFDTASYLNPNRTITFYDHRCRPIYCHRLKSRTEWYNGCFYKKIYTILNCTILRSNLNTIPGCIAIVDIHCEFDNSFFTISCFTKSYILTFLWVYK